jgi:hypothetical protein
MPTVSRLLLTAAAGLAGLGTLVSTSSFGGTTLSAPQPTVRRLTETQYRAAIAEAFGPKIEVVGRFEPDMRVGGLTAVGASAISITPAGFEQYDAIARHIAAQVFAPDHRAELVGCSPGAGDPDGARCAASFVERTGLKLYRRPLNANQVRTAVARTLAGAQKLGSFDAGLEAMLVGMLTSPDFLFRIDVPARAGPRDAIDSYSKATRLSFLLWNAPPDEALLAAAASRSLDTPDGLKAQVDRMIASPRFNDGVRAFFDDFLHLQDIDNLSKDALIYPAFSTTVAAAAREQTLRTITDLLVDHKGDYRDLFTTRRFAMTRALGPIYNVPVAGTGWSMHEFPEGDPRIGLLTQVSLLALHSHPGRTSPTLRGKSIRETVLCQEISPPPANVNFAVVQDVNNATLKTTRQRLEAHLDDEECASCHKATDGIGLSFEQFDGAGSFRSTEHDEPIDVSGKFDKVSFAGVAELGQLFHDSPKVSQCLVSTVWRYANGRSIDVSDRPDLDNLNASFSANGYRFIDLMRTIAVDPRFYVMPHVPLAQPVAAAEMQPSPRGRS